MATIHEIPAQSRKDEGKGASRRLRRAGKLPAIVYGAHQDPASIELTQKDVLQAAQFEWFYSSILDLNLEGQKQKVLLRDMQRHPHKHLVLHVDFQRVSENEAIRLRVPLHFLNQEKSSAGKTSGVVVMHELTDIEISCLPKDLPEFIAVDLGELNVGDIVHVSELKLPAGVEIPQLRLGKEYDVAVVVAKTIKEEVEPVVEAVAAEGAAAAAPAAAGAAPGAAPAAPAAGAPAAKKEEKK